MSADLEALVEKFAPVVYFHPDDPYHPSSVEWYMAGTEYHTPSVAQPYAPGTWSFDGAVGHQVNPDDDQAWMQIPGDDGTAVDVAPAVQAVRAGSLDAAALYVHVQPVRGRAHQLDIQYWFFYPFNGQEHLHFEASHGFSSEIDLPLSLHQGDWEQVTVRVDLTEQSITAVLYAAHSGATWFGPATGSDPSGFSLENGHPVVYVASQTHASYPTQPGPFEIGGLDILIQRWVLEDYTSKTGTRVDFSQPGRCVIVSNEATALFPAVTPPSWLSFTGRWGVKSDIPATPALILHLVLGIIEASPIEGTIVALAISWMLTPLGASAASALAAVLFEAIYRRSEDGPTTPSQKGSWRGRPEPLAWTNDHKFSGASGHTWTTSDQAALVAAGASPLALYRSASNSTIYVSTFIPTNRQWTPNQPIAGLASDDGVAAIVYDARGSVALVGVSRGKLQCWLFPEPAGTWHPAPGWPAPAATTGAALGQLGERIVCVWRDSTGALHVITTDDLLTWTDRGTVTGTRMAAPSTPFRAHSPALGTVAGTLVAVYMDEPLETGSLPTLAAVTSTDGIDWEGPAPLDAEADTDNPSHAATITAPTLATIDDTLYCAWAEQSAHVRLSATSDGIEWSLPVDHPNALSVLPPTLLAWNDQLLLVHRGKSHSDLWWSQTTWLG